MESQKRLGIILLAFGCAIIVFYYVYTLTKPAVILSPVPYDIPAKVSE
jgi:hypothetical protein